MGTLHLMCSRAFREEMPATCVSPFEVLSWPYWVHEVGFQLCLQENCKNHGNGFIFSTKLKKKNSSWALFQLLGQQHE